MKNTGSDLELHKKPKKNWRDVALMSVSRENIAYAFRYFVYVSLLSLKNIRRIRFGIKSLALVSVAFLVPLIGLSLVFYGPDSVKNLGANINILRTEQGDAQEEAVDNQDVDIVSHREFIREYIPSPAFLPREVKSTGSLSEFLEVNRPSELLPVRNWSVPFVDLKAKAAIAVDVNTGRVLYGKNTEEIRSIASITKLATALVAVDELNLDDEVTMSQNAVDTQGDSANLTAGERLTVEQLLYALLLESSNDAGVALQEFHDANKSDNAPDFMSLMNEKARELGMKDTFFEEPTGLSSNNTSTTIDVAKLMVASLENDTIRTILRTRTYTTRSQNMNRTHNWVNLNSLVGAVDGVLGGKTGFTNAAGPSLVIGAEPIQDRLVVVVVLYAENRIEETRTLYEWIKEAYIWHE